MFVDVSSSTWMAVAEFARKEIESAQAALEKGPGPNGPSDDHQRGRIKAMRELLELAAPKPAIQRSEPVSYGVQTGQ